MTDASAALREIARLRAPFVSRGDNSGTHVAEQRLWQAAKVNPKARSGNWYRETGLGMGLTVQMATRLGGLHADRPRHLAAKSDNRASSVILLDSDPRLFNPYEVVLVNPDQASARQCAGGEHLHRLAGLARRQGRDRQPSGERRAAVHARRRPDQLAAAGRARAIVTAVANSWKTSKVCSACPRAP